MMLKKFLCPQIYSAARGMRFYSDPAAPLSIYDKLRNDMKVSMRAKNMEDLTIIRSLLSDITYAEKNAKNKGKDIKNDESIVSSLLQTAILQREESIREYTQVKRDDLASKEQKQIDFIKKYLPPQLTAEEITKIASDAVKALNANSVKQIPALLKEMNIDPSIAHRTRVVEVLKGILIGKESK
ncbi:hypothetical protein BB560_002323 [Smittium megazygosporum]|uniref:Altered inheritance of mitochondria protein 41 n=1 Tax=Smittium megazygosporum TaxID=133381 RepID=A0A2T9ZF73_9FUNG|nr:hypothetical protein BB560_005504 [Smittium megazygosporum]PVV03209.1 hypothetical protein BB560_002323 [Smittium megazygosporum]